MVETVDVDKILEDAGLSRRTAFRAKASLDELPDGYTLDPLKAIMFLMFCIFYPLIHVCLQASHYTVH